MHTVLNDFIQYKNLDDSIISAYSNQIPSEILAIWSKLGSGSFMNGYLRIINPNDFKELLNETYFRGNEAIPIMVTGFGDVITWEKGKYLGIVKYRYGTFDILENGCDYFFDDLLDEEYVHECLESIQYLEAIEKLGKLDYDECFGYVPLLGLGGSEKVENLKKVKIREHIEIIAQLVGKIGM